MRCEKWHSLGNDYLVIEEGVLPWDLSPERVRRLCDRHTGFGADGVLGITVATEPGTVARLRVFNPDGSEAELSGNGARQAAVYLHRSGWTERREFSIQTRAGELRAQIAPDGRTCTMAMGRARLASGDFPGGPDDGIATIDSGGRRWAGQHVQVGNPQFAIRVDSEPALDELDLQEVGPGIERHEAFPNRTNVSFYCETGPDRIRARIFERGVGETSASGTGASGAAIAHVLRGGDNPVTVALDGGELIVDADESLLYSLTGWAEPVYGAQLSDELMATLAAC